jgi:hypothetical protein
MYVYACMYYVCMYMYVCMCRQLRLSRPGVRAVEVHSQLYFM